MITNQRAWQQALLSVWEQYDTWFAETDLDIRYADSPGSMPHHGCPPPLPPADDHHTVTSWQGQPLLWCDPARWPDEVERTIPRGHTVQVACMGTMFWLQAHALKTLGLEQQVSTRDWARFKSLSHNGAHQGFADAAVELGWASRVIHDVEQIQFGDLVGIRRGGAIHHWCIAWEDPHATDWDGRAILRVMGASGDPVDGVGLEERWKEWRDRDWVAAAMFR